MNVSLKEFKRLEEENLGRAIIFTDENGARLIYENQDASQRFTLVTVANKARYFKSVSSLHNFLKEYFPLTTFRLMAL